MHHSTLLVIAASVLPSAVRGHAAIFGQGTFGHNSNLNAELANPLDASSGGQNQWFFRNQRPESAGGSFDLQPGGSQSFTVACSKNNANDGSDNPCNSPNDGALHRQSDGSGSGCALSISYKPFDQIQPNDMKVFSVLHDCVKTSKTHTFQIPNNLPAGEATCAWHWIPPPESSASEMYMTGFNCNIQGNNGGNVDSAAPARYFAVQGFQDGERPLYERLFDDGAQQLNTGGGSVNVNAGVNAGNGSNNDRNNNSNGQNDNSRSNEQSSNQQQQQSNEQPQQQQQQQSNNSSSGKKSKSSKSSSGRCGSGKRKRSSKRHQHRRHHAHGLAYDYES